MRNERKPHCLRAGGNDAVLKPHHPFLTGLVLSITSGEFYFQVVRIQELAAAAYHLDLARLGHSRQPGRELADDFGFPPSQFVEIDLWFAEGNTMLGQRRGFIGNSSDV